mgnify:FL=1
MGFIKEPEGITFYVENRELTSEEKKMLSEFFAKQNKKAIKSIEVKNERKRNIKKRISKKKILTWTEFILKY